MILKSPSVDFLLSFTKLAEVYCPAELKSICLFYSESNSDLFLPERMRTKLSKKGLIASHSLSQVHIKKALSSVSVHLAA